MLIFIILLLILTGFFLKHLYDRRDSLKRFDALTDELEQVNIQKAEVGIMEQIHKEKRKLKPKLDKLLGERNEH